MPNEPGVATRPWQDYRVSVDEIERQTGYDYLANVPPLVQNALESRVGAAP